MFPELFAEHKSPFESYIDENRRKELEKIIQIENELAKKVVNGELKIEDIIPERKLGDLVPLKPEHYAPPQPAKVQKAGTEKMEEQKPTRKRKAFTIDDVDMSKVEKHPGTGLPIIRNGKDIIVLPPHKHPKEIPDLYPEATYPRAAPHIFERLTTDWGIKDPQEFKKAIDIVARGISLYRKALLEEEDVKKAESRARKQLWEEIHKHWSKDKTAKNAEAFAEDIISAHSFNTAFDNTYTADHAISEVAAGEVQIHETKDLAVDILKNPEKYGVRKGDIEKMLEIIKEKSKHIKGFGHKKM